jgi:hypothetical protein
MNTRLLALPLIFATACPLPSDEDGGGSDGGDDPSDTVTAQIGPDGGMLGDERITLAIPAGALPEATMLSMSIVDAPADAMSPRWHFEPAGLAFAQPVWVQITLDDAGAGALLWSLAEDDTAFESIGIAAGGVASGYTTHFSDAYVAPASCESPPAAITKCGCRAGDEIGDLVCPVEPADGACPSINGFMGQDGGGCSGYALRDETEFHCACYSQTDGYLCPEAYILGPMQSCPTEDGLGGHIGEPGASCSGYTTATNPDTMETMNKSGSGTLVDCSEVVIATEYESIGGTLEGCYETSMALPPCQKDANGNEYYGVTAECQMRLDTLAMAGQTTACPSAVGTAATVGSRAGNQLETIFKQQNPTDWYTQVTVPFGGKASCDTMAPPEVRGDGAVDVLRVVSRSATETVIEIAEIKPLTPTGIPAGFHEVYECYKDVLAAVGEQCDDENPDMFVAKFCSDIGATGTKVKVADPIGLEVGAQAFKYEAADGSKHPMDVMTCFPGVIAYACV